MKRLNAKHVNVTADFTAHHQGDVSPRSLSACLPTARSSRVEANGSFPSMSWKTYPLISLCSGSNCNLAMRSISHADLRIAPSSMFAIPGERPCSWCVQSRLSWRSPRSSRLGRSRDCSRSCGSRAIGGEEGDRPGFQVLHWTPVSSPPLPYVQCLHSSEVDSSHSVPRRSDWRKRKFRRASCTHELTKRNHPSERGSSPGWSLSPPLLGVAVPRGEPPCTKSSLRSLPLQHHH